MMEIILFNKNEFYLFFFVKAKPHEYIAQIKLAKQITILIHGGENFI